MLSALLVPFSPDVRKQMDAARSNGCIIIIDFLYSRGKVIIL